MLYSNFKHILFYASFIYFECSIFLFLKEKAANSSIEFVGARKEANNRHFKFFSNFA